MKTSFLKPILAGLVLAAPAIPAARGETPATLAVEGRGLPQVEGVVRNGDKVDWGFANFVAFGPGWAFTAQDSVPPHSLTLGRTAQVPLHLTTATMGALALTS